MHVVVILGPFLPPPPGPAGAVERAWYGLAIEFARRGHRVTLICRSPPGEPAGRTPDGVEIVRVAGASRPRRAFAAVLRDYWYSRRAARAVPPAADLVLTNGFWLPVLVRRAGGRPLVMPNVQRMPKGQLRLYGGVDRLLVVSEAVRAAVEAERPQLSARTRVIPNPIDTAAFHPGGRRDHPGPPGVLFAGRLHPEKGLELLLAAARRLADARLDFRLRVVGPSSLAEGGGGPDYLDRLRRQSLGLPVSFHDPIYDRAALADEYRRAAVFCYPSVAERGETFGVAPLEAMACGAVAVVSDLACFRDYLRPEGNGLAFDHRGGSAAENLADGLSRVLTDPRLQQRLREEGERTAAGYGYAAVADLYLAAFAEALG